MHIVTIKLKKPSSDIPWLPAPPEAEAIIKKYMDEGKILHKETSIIDNLNASTTFIFIDIQARDEFLSDKTYADFVKYHNEEHCVKHGIEITKIVEDI